MQKRWAVLLLGLCALLPGPRVLAKDADLAVLPVAFGDQRPPAELAQMLNQALVRRGVQTLSQEQVIERLGKGQWPQAADSDRVAQQLKKLRVGGGDLASSVQSLETLITMLERDPMPSTEKTQLLQESRLLIARQLYNLAFFTKDRKKTAGLQKKIFIHLQAAVRTDPFVSMPLETFSPEVRRLLDLARKHVADAPRGQLEVHSRVAGATVFIDGRKVGQTPRFIDANLPQGSYRVWLVNGDCQSRTHEVQVTELPAVLDVTMDFDCAVDPTSGALRFAENQVISEQVALAGGAALGVQRLILVGSVMRDEGEWLYAALYDLTQHRSVRQGAVRRSEPLEPQIELLADFFSSPQGAEVTQPAPFDLPLAGAQPTSVLASAASPSALHGLVDHSIDARAIGGAAAGAVAIVGWAVGGGGLVSWSQAYAGLDRPNLDREQRAGLTGQANTGWNLALAGLSIGALSGVTSAGLLAWWWFDAKQAEEANEAPRAQTEEQP